MSEAVLPVDSTDAPGVPEARVPIITEYIGVVVFFVLCGALALRLWSASGRELLWILPVTATIGFIFADFFSGLVHWAFDTWGAPTTPVLGKMFIVPFRIHHTDPIDIARHGFVATNGHNCLVSAPILAGAYFLPMDPLWGRFSLAMLTAMCLGVFATNQFHKWAHQESVSRGVAAMQRWGIILSPQHHSQHHSQPYDNYYCITTGWVNPLLARTKFFRHAERAISTATGMQPRMDDLKPFLEKR